MTGRQLFSIMGEVEDSMIQEAETYRILKGSRKKKIMGKALIGAAACALLAAGGWLAFRALGAGENGNSLDLPNSHNVAAYYAEPESGNTAMADLPWFTEEELFHGENTDIFRGKVTSLKNIRVEFGEETLEELQYRAVAEIQVDKVYRGSCTPGQTVKVLLPCPAGLALWIEDTKTVSQMEEGTEGIFMPVRYDETDVWKEGDGALQLSDLAEYGFLDGERYAFLEKEGKLIYADWAYPSLESSSGLEDVEVLIARQLAEG